MELRRLVTLVSVIVCVDTAFFAVVAPLLPHYADELELSKLSAGLLAAAYPAGTILGAIPAGLLAARFGSRATVIAGLTLLGLSSLVFGFAEHVVVLDAARFVQGIGGACSWAGGLAWITAEAPADQRGALIGTALGAAIFGTLLGPVLGALADVTAPELVFSSVLVIAGGLSVAALRMPSTSQPEPQRLSDVGRALRDGGVRTAMWLVTLPAIAFGTLTVLVPLRLDDLGFGTAAVGAVFLVAAAVESAESPIVGRVSDRRGRLVPVRAGLAAGTVMLLIITLPANGVLYALAFVLTTGSLGVFWAPAMALLSDAAEGTGVAQGLAFGLVNLGWGIGETLGAAGGGGVAKATADIVPVACCAGACLLTLLTLRRVPTVAPATVQA